MVWALLWLAPLAFLALFYFLPLGSILRLSFARGEGGWAQPLAEIFTSPYIRGVLGFTFGQAALSTLLTLLFGLPGAYLLARYQFRGKSLVQALAGIPFVMPTLVVAAAFDALLGPSGWINRGLMALFALDQPPVSFTYSLGAILTAHVFYNTTIVLRTVGDFWSHLDPRLEQAARVLGANRWQVLRRVTLPLLAPAIASAALLVFIFDFTSFGVILVLGGPQFATLEVEIYNQTTNLLNLPLAAALSLLQLACTLALTVIYTRLSRRLSRPISLRPQAYTQRRLTTWRSRLMAGVILVTLLGLLTTPLAALALRSVTRLEPDRGQQTYKPGFTLNFYRELGINRRSSIAYVPPVTAIGVSLGYAAAHRGALAAPGDSGGLGAGAPCQLTLQPHPGSAAHAPAGHFGGHARAGVYRGLRTAAQSAGLAGAGAAGAHAGGISIRGAQPHPGPAQHPPQAAAGGGSAGRLAAPGGPAHRPAAGRAGGAGGGNLRLHDLAGRIRRHGADLPPGISNRAGGDLSFHLPPGRPELRARSGAQHDLDAGVRRRDAGDRAAENRGCG